ncbi:hypothetical protein ACFYPQ_42045 [Streptomyces sp. NPDC005522]|uniref:hypothetical protein n=1 Tax=unclassified Streptomyces TaxID=2593676 RepID=UPI0033AFA34D
MEWRLPEPMLAKAVEDIPTGPLAYEAKWDGSPDTLLCLTYLLARDQIRWPGQGTGAVGTVLWPLPSMGQLLTLPAV